MNKRVFTSVTFVTFLTSFTCLMSLPLVSLQAAEGEDEHPGAEIYSQYCGICHNQPDVTRAPALVALQQLSADTLRLALTEGIMQEQAKALDRRQLAILIDYLAKKESDGDAWLSGWMCPADQRDVDLDQPTSFSGFGTGYPSQRSLSAATAGITSAELSNLALAWAVGFPDTNSLRAGAAIVGDTMFYSPTQTRRVLALDVTKPCVKWVYDAGTDTRTSIAYGTLGESGKRAIVFGDRRGQVHAVDAKTGELIWRAEGRHSEGAGLTGAPVIYKDKIIVPVSGSGVARGANPKYECCAEHGAVVALDAKNGEKVWTWHTMEEAKYTGKTNSLGIKLRGPSGAPIWSTPSIDTARGVVYVTTGQNTSLPPTNTSDAVIAIDLDTGKQKWVFQALEKDVWIMSCRSPVERSGPNCPSPEDSVLKDFDFGAAAILAKTSTGEDIILAGQKSGDVWGINPNDGTKVWNIRFGQGTPLGGVHWGMATDGKLVFAPINDPSPPYPGFMPEPGMNAVNIETGEVVWRYSPTPNCPEARSARIDLCGARFGFSAAPLVIDRSLIAGSLDGRLYVFDAATGNVTFEFDTLRDFHTVNGIAAKGGSIDSHSIFAGAGMVFVGSGYGSFREASGNVLLAFRPKRK